jgi:tol-pal system protein YbgF
MRQLGAVVLVSLLAGCAVTPPEEDPVQIKLNDLEARLERIERVVANQSLVDMAQKVDSTAADVRSLRGRVDQLENGAESLRKQQRDLYSDLDKRLAAASLGGVPGASGAPGSAAGEQAAYTQAFDALKTSNYPAAISGFQQFLNTYPDSTLGDNAQYWLGEAYYVTRDYGQAATAFRIVGQRWPDSRKSADALLKLGYSQFELKQYAEARATLNDVTRRFPDSDAARLAAERLRRIPASAR